MKQRHLNIAVNWQNCQSWETKTTQHIITLLGLQSAHCSHVLTSMHEVNGEERVLTPERTETDRQN